MKHAQLILPVWDFLGEKLFGTNFLILLAKA